MKSHGFARKRPCRVCRRWFQPDARLGDRQKTCGDPECKREWHPPSMRPVEPEESGLFQKHLPSEKSGGC